MQGILAPGDGGRGGVFVTPPHPKHRESTPAFPFRVPRPCLFHQDEVGGHDPLSQQLWEPSLIPGDCRGRSSGLWIILGPVPSAAQE